MVWQVEVLDGDPEARDKMVRVKLAAAVRPVPPAAADGVPFRPVVDKAAVAAVLVEPADSSRLGW